MQPQSYVLVVHRIVGSLVVAWHFTEIESNGIIILESTGLPKVLLYFVVIITDRLSMLDGLHGQEQSERESIGLS